MREFRWFGQFAPNHQMTHGDIITDSFPIYLSRENGTYFTSFEVKLFLFYRILLVSTYFRFCLVVRQIRMLVTFCIVN